MNRFAAGFAAGIGTAIVLAVGSVVGVSLIQGEDHFAVPTEAEARAVLAQHVGAFGSQPRKDWYCNHADTDDDECWVDWDAAGGDKAAPTSPPHVLAVRGGSRWRVLDVCGRDGLGRPYLNPFFVGTSGGSPRSRYAVYWHAGESPSSRPPECP